ncbi:Lin0512 family protein, partial [Paracoccaceae bacterium]|nr:Lin0512 family protein [Paracoccaceae bacterium]
LPYGQSTFKVIKGGLDIIKPDGKGATVVANVAVIVSFNMERANDQ